MSCRIQDRLQAGRTAGTGKVSVICCIWMIIALFTFSGCSEKPVPTPVKKARKAAKKSPNTAPVPMQDVIAQQDNSQEGYIYDQRDRRDPFVPLIVPKKPADRGDDVKPGTLISYDLMEFSLAAIARKGSEYYGLLTTPDNRSFTVTRGTPIGMNKGKVKDITRDKLILVEYTRDYKGDLKPRELILEFHKGEVE